MEQGSLLENLSITAEDLHKVAEYFTLVHHTPGRIRLRASLKLKKKVSESDLDLDSLQNKIQNIPVIKNIKFNRLIGSLTLEYDAKLFEPSLWDSWLKGERLEEISQKLNKILKEIQ